MILSVSDLSMAFGEDVLFDRVSFRVEARDKIGVIGANGSGKTTLFNLILGNLLPEHGGVVRASGLTVGYAQQYACKNSEKTAYEETLSVFSDLLCMEKELSEVKKALESSSDAALIARYEDLHENFLALDGLTFRSRTAAALSGLGFSEEEQQLPIASLSGGQRSKIELARLLLAAPALLLLDEPTNHLDIPSVAWLEDFLVSYKGAALIISHDRYFLDRVTTRTFSIENKKFYTAEGNYSKFRAVHDQIKAAELKNYENTMREVHRIEDMVTELKRWNREKSIKKAESKEKQIERLTEGLEAPDREEKPILPTFPIALESGTEVLSCTDAAVSFDGTPLFDHVDLTVRRGERVFLVGSNGCGKTTLLRYLLTNPRVKFGVGVKTGYFDQHGEGVNSEKTAFGDLRDAFPSLGDTELRTALAAYRFRGEDVFRNIGSMSGGERARVLLCKLGLKKANFLLLDEPTNHLDLPSREALETALRDYRGTLLVVSHDRYFINALATRVVELSPHGITSYEGNYDDYLLKKSPETAAVKTEKKPSEQKEQYLKRKKDAAALRSMRAEMRRTEAAIAETETKIAALHQELATDEVATDYEKITALSAQLEEAETTLKDRMDLWETLALSLEEMGESEP